MNKIFKRKIEQPAAMKIRKIIDEAKDIRTFVFSRGEDILDEKGYRERHFSEHNIFTAVPGQFVMLWLPEVDMKPFGISHQDYSYFSLTICKVGPFTEKLFLKKVGDYVGIQGPHGTGFSTNCKNAVLVAGGYGVAPLAFLADELSKSGADVKFIIGAKTKESVLFQDRFKNSKVQILYTTDDGSFGEKGYATDALRRILEKNQKENIGKDQSSSIDMIYTCGPEIMMKKVIEISDEFNIDCQASLERYMKCGFGICGQCCCDGSGVRICTSGPAFSKEFIKKNISEFGNYKRDGTGKKIVK
jgi:dihydroorotate dehydrogenase electron transfer subunit